MSGWRYLDTEELKKGGVHHKQDHEGEMILRAGNDATETGPKEFTEASGPALL